MFKKAIYAGSFDPFTLGHLDIVQRGLKLFDEIIIAVAVNEDKKPLFSLEQRLAMVRHVVQGLDGVQVVALEGLTVDYAKAIHAQALLRGVRKLADMEHELQLAQMNQQMHGELETVLLPTSPQWMAVSSGLIKDIARLGGDVSTWVSPFVVEQLHKVYQA